MRCDRNFLCSGKHSGAKRIGSEMQEEQPEPLISVTPPPLTFDELLGTFNQRREPSTLCSLGVPVFDTLGGEVSALESSDRTG
jgi:hypothetical protein